MCDPDPSRQYYVWLNVVGELDTYLERDVTIKCGGEEFKVHRAVLCPSSTFFNSALRGSFKEAKTGVIELKEDEPFLVQAMISFLYAAFYLPLYRDEDKNFEGEDEMILHAMVGVFAEKYNVENLEEYAQERFDEKLKEWKPAIRGKVFQKVLQVIYSAAAGEASHFRHAIVRYIAQSSPNYRDHSAVTGLFSKYPELSVDIATKLFLMRVQDRT